MSNIFTRKLELFIELSQEDKEFLEALVRRPREIVAHKDLIREGDEPTDVNLIIRGFAYRYKHLPDGSRYILGCLIPGDLTDLHMSILDAMDHSIATLSACQVVNISRASVLELTQRPAICHALHWINLIEQAMLREWLINIGRRNGVSRIAHWFSEIYTRLSSVGLIDSLTFELPITQIELGDMLGMSAVHINRSLQNLRAQNVLTMKGKEVSILNFARLQRIGEFTPSYLHLRPALSDRN